MKSQCTWYAKCASERDDENHKINALNFIYDTRQHRKCNQNDRQY